VTYTSSLMHISHQLSPTCDMRSSLFAVPNGRSGAA
jgi:hypothetical protein